MIYDGKQASEEMKKSLRERVALLADKPVLAVVSIAIHPSIISFIKIKRNFAESIGIGIEEYDFKETETEEILIQKIKELSQEKRISGIIVQLPLPQGFDSQRVLDAIPEHLDVDVLGTSAWNTFVQKNNPVPPVAGAIAHILEDTDTDIANKNVVIIGQGKLVGLPVATWFSHSGIVPNIVTIDTEESTRLKLYKEADIIVSGIGKPSSIKPDHIQEDVVILDAGTSEQSGMIVGDCDPLCAEKASVFTPVPRGIGPLTVAFLFHNLITFTEQRK